MTTIKLFKDIIVWQKSRELTIDIYKAHVESMLVGFIRKLSAPDF